MKIFVLSAFTGAGLLVDNLVLFMIALDASPGNEVTYIIILNICNLIIKIDLGWAAMRPK
jgi:hypothetical protein